jgi:signal transduction histidine kinase
MEAGSGRILVVDDERINRVLLSTNLDQAGYVVEEAADGEQALEMLRARAFDVVLLDLIMPRMDGFRVLAAMKGERELRRIPVIVVSSMDDMDSVVRCIEMGATDYLAKPFNPVLLHARLKASLASLHEERMSVLRRQLAQVTAAQEEERQRIAQELHDGVGPTLASLNLRLRTVRKLLAGEDHPAVSELEELARLTKACIRDIRRLIQDLRPAVLEELGLMPALRNYLIRYQEEHGIEVDLALPTTEERLPMPAETVLFRFAQEALANVAKHAQAQKVSIELKYEGDRVDLSVTDNGKGFDPLERLSSKHLGLWSMRERAEQAGGRFEIKSEPGAGTMVCTSIPMALVV